MRKAAFSYAFFTAIRLLDPDCGRSSRNGCPTTRSCVGVQSCCQKSAPGPVEAALASLAQLHTSPMIYRTFTKAADTHDYAAMSFRLTHIYQVRQVHAASPQMARHAGKTVLTGLAVPNDDRTPLTGHPT